MATGKAVKQTVHQALTAKPTATNAADFSIVSQFLG